MPSIQSSVEGRVHLMRTDPHASRTELSDWTVRVLLTADAASRLPAQAALQELILSFAQRSDANSLETFAEELSSLSLAQQGHVDQAEVTVESHLWKRLIMEGEPSPGAFMKGSDERQFTQVSRSQAGLRSICSGFTGMTVLRSWPTEAPVIPNVAPNAQDASGHRLFRTMIDATWCYEEQAMSPTLNFSMLRSRLREQCLSNFLALDLNNLPHSLQMMAETALHENDSVGTFTLRARPMQLLAVSPHAAGRRHVVIPSEASPTSYEVTVRRTASQSHP